MNYNFKPLINLAIGAIAVLIVLMLVQIQHVWNTAATTNTVSFSGEGKITAKPDIAMISASVVTNATEAKTAQDQNATKSNAVTDFLKAQGIDEKDIKTSNYNIYPQYNYPQYGGQPSISGYQVSQSFDVKVRDLTKVSKIISGLVSAGANQVNNLGLQIDNPEALQAQARQLAIDNAKKKAQDLQSQVGISLGHIVGFSENTGGTPIMYAARGMGGGSAPSPDISAGQNEIVSDVTLIYQIK